MCQIDNPSFLCTEEAWLQIPFLDNYEASCRGQIRHRKSKHIKAIDKSWNGYWRIQVSIRKDGEWVNRKYRVHRLVAAAWISDNKENDVDHKDGDKSNNAAWNLQYLSHDANVHKYYDEQKPVEST